MIRCLAAIFAALLLASVAHGQEYPPPDSASLGVLVLSLSDVAPTLKNAKAEPPAKIGVYVVLSISNGPAQQAGIGTGAVITRVARQPVKDRDAFLNLVRESEVGKPVEVAGYRLTTAGGKARWKAASVKVKPDTWRNVVLGAMSKTTDDIRGLTFYQHAESPKNVNERSDLFAYIVVDKSGKPALRLKIQYVANDWLFIESFTAKVGDKVMELDVSDFDAMKRDFSGGRIWEWYDGPAEGPALELIKGIANGKGETTLRANGKDYRKDREIELEERLRLQTVIAAFDLLGGKL